MLERIKVEVGKVGLLVHRIIAFLTGKYDEVIRKLEIRVDNCSTYIFKIATQVENKVKENSEDVENLAKEVEILKKTIGAVLGEQNDPSYTNFKVIKSLQTDVSTIKNHLPEAILLQDTRKEYEEVMKTALLVQTENTQLKLKIEQLESDIKELNELTSKFGNDLQSLSVLVYAKKGV